MNSVLPRTVFRHLMRSARIFDRHPVLKALLSKYSVSSDLGNLLSSFLCGQNFYLPTPLMPRSLEEFTRQTYCYPPSPEATIDTALAGLRYLNALLRLAEQHGLYSGRALQQSSDERHETTVKCADSTLPKDGTNRETIPGLQILLNEPELGALLIAHPLQQGYFKRAVVLVTASHPHRGSTGLCIDSQSETKQVLVKDYREHWSQVHGRLSPVDLVKATIERSDNSKVEASDTDEEEGPLFAITFEVEIKDTDGKEEAHTSMEDAYTSRREASRLHEDYDSNIKPGGAEHNIAKKADTREAMETECSGRSESVFSALLDDGQFLEFFSCSEVCDGGPVNSGSLYTLHKRADLGGTPVFPDKGPGLRFGVSVEKLREQMSKGTVSADELQFFDGESIWAPLQLETELASGAWMCVKMKTEDLVRLQQDQMRKQAAEKGDEQLWNWLLQSVGGEHRGLSTIPVSLAEDIARLDLT